MPIPPQLETMTVADLIGLAMSGRVRVPSFQRTSVWDADHVVALFDSIARGLPIGALAFLRKPAPAERVLIGPVEIEATAEDHALWVLDGQQRITALIGGLTAPDDADDERFRIFYDLETGLFRSLAPSAAPHVSWLPANLLLNDRSRLAWYQEPATASEANREVRAGEALAAQFQDYRIAVYELDGDSLPADNSTIFIRLNTSAVALTADDIRHAQQQNSPDRQPVTLESLARSLAGTGFGHLDVPTLRGYLAAIHLPRHDLISLDRLTRDGIRFLRREADVPHLTALPQHSALPAVALFIRHHGYPEGRVAELLRRWLWRRFAADAATRSRLVDTMEEALGADPYDTLTALLAQPPDERVLLPRSVLRTDSPLGLLGMLSGAPSRLETGEPENSSALFKYDRSPLVPIFAESPRRDLANMILATGTADRGVRDLLISATPEVLTSHLVDAAALGALAAHQEGTFLDLRGQSIINATQSLVDDQAEWGARGGRTMADLMRTVAE